MDIKVQISKIVEEVTKDKSLLEDFKKDPKQVVEKLLGVDLPEDVVEKIVEGVKAKISLDKIPGMDNLKKMF